MIKVRDRMEWHVKARYSNKFDSMANSQIYSGMCTPDDERTDCREVPLLLARSCLLSSQQWITPTNHGLHEL